MAPLIPELTLPFDDEAAVVIGEDNSSSSEFDFAQQQPVEANTATIITPRSSKSFVGAAIASAREAIDRHTFIAPEDEERQIQGDWTAEDDSHLPEFESGAYDVLPSMNKELDLPSASSFEEDDDEDDDDETVDEESPIGTSSPRTVTANISAPGIRRGSASHRRVSFVPVVDVLLVPSRDDIGIVEARARWFDLDEMERIREDLKSDARLAELRLLGETETFTARGLEAQTRTGRIQRRHHRENAYDAVFFEIACQRREGAFDEDAIASMYCAYNRSCREAAKKLARQDEIEARNICRDIVAEE